MKNHSILLPGVFALLLLAAPAAWTAGTNDSEGETFRLLDNALGHVDLKFLSGDKGDFGIDYGLHLNKTVTPIGRTLDPSEPERLLRVNLKSAGFITVNADENENSSIISEFALSGDPLWYAPSGEIGKLLREEEKKLPPGEVLKRTQTQAAALNSPLWFYLDLHGRYETTQDFDQHDFAFGSGIKITTSYLNEALDTIFKQLRFGPQAASNNPRQLYLSFGYDLVTELDHTATAALRGGENDANRLAGYVEWETGILYGQRIVLSYSVYYELDAPAGVRQAGKDLNQFVEIRIDLLTSKHLEQLFGKIPAASDRAAYSFSIKYTSGELPPNYTSGSVLGAGFSLDF